MVERVRISSPRLSDPARGGKRSRREIKTVRYSYDQLDRVTEACYQSAPCTGTSEAFIRWSYDPVGNRLSETRPTGSTSYSYNAGDQLLAAGSLSFAYDANGNQIAAGPRSFSYDLAGRVASTTAAGTTTSYGYDGEGKRLQAEEGAAATGFLWDVNAPLPQLALEQDAAAMLVRRYSYGHGRVVHTSAEGTFYHHADMLGSVASISSATGALQWSYEYEPFGGACATSRHAAAAPDNPMRFTGEQLDPTGLYHLRARQYEPASGRFLSVERARGGSLGRDHCRRRRAAR